MRALRPPGRNSDNYLELSKLRLGNRNDLNLPNFFGLIFYFFIRLRMVSGLSPSPTSLLAI